MEENIVKLCCWCALILTTVFALQENSFGQKRDVEIIFQGNNAFSSDVLQKELDKCPYNFREISDDEHLKDRISICLRGTVHKIYAEKGMWIGSKMESLVEVENTEAGRKIIIPLEEVEPVYMGNINVESGFLKLISREKFLEDFPVKKGEVINYIAVRNYYQKLRDLYYNNGYLAFEIDYDDETYTNSENGKATKDYTLKISEGKPFIIKSVQFKRNENLDAQVNKNLTDELLEKTLGLKKGQIYNEDDLQEGLKRLNKISGLGEVKNSRQYDIYSLSSASSANLNIEENYKNNTVEVFIYITNE